MPPIILHLMEILSRNQSLRLEAIQHRSFSYEAADAYNILGVNLYSLDRFEEAKKAFQKAGTHYMAWKKQSDQKNPEFEGALALNLGNIAKQQKTIRQSKRDHYIQRPIGFLTKWDFRARNSVRFFKSGHY